MADQQAIPPVVRTEVDWSRYVQMALMAIVAAFTGTNAWRGSPPSSGDPNIPPAPPAPVVTAATLHDDNLRLEKKLDELLEAVNPPKK